MGSEQSIDETRRFWTEQAKRHGESFAASWCDGHVIEMEIREIVRRLDDGDRVLDAGCANGYSTIEFARRKSIRIDAVDYVPEMVVFAKKRAERLGKASRGHVNFEVGDVTALRHRSDTYDKVVATRVIINLGHWDRQLTGLRECARILKPGGLLLVSDATLQGWQRLNGFRREWGLPDIPMPRHNNYLDEGRLVDSLAPELELEEASNFSSTYFVGTRVIKPLLAKALGTEVNVADPDMEWNRWFSMLPSWGDYGTQQLFVFRKG